MKLILKYSGLYLMLVMTLLTVLNMDGVSQRKNEMHNALNTSMRTVLKANNINEMYDMDKSDMKIELIRNIADNINTDSGYTVEILKADEEGLLDVRIISSFEHLNGQEDTRAYRKTMIADELPSGKE